MLENLRWKPFPEDDARAVVAQLLDAESPDVLSDYQIRGSIAALPPYQTQHLLQLVAKYRAAEAWHVTLYALYSEDATPLLLNGESGAVYIANEREQLQLTEETVVDYVRFFCFAVRGPEGPFILIEPSKPDQAKSGKLAELAKPISVTGRDESQRILCEAVMEYNGGVFNATMAVAAGGQIEMVDDLPLTADFQEGELPVLPDLGSGSALRLHVSAMKAGIAAVPTASGLAPLEALTELLLESALQKQAGHRLIE